ncbi:MAG: HDOD domain-containing protein [Dechloromonas sp.]|jgi:EAL and modified HD-GYP domain-containing signal transduction protein|nr:HDOD domain-containing protein [Dechloromonas sp.]
MTSQVHTFIHPLLDPVDACGGYLVELSANGSENHQATEYIVRHSLLDAFDHRHPWFVPAAPLDSASPARLIATFHTCPSAQPDPLESGLRQSKRKLALALAANGKLPASGAWEHLLITLSQARTLPSFTLQGLSARTMIVATGVQNHSDRDWARGHACTLCTGEYLMTRAALGKKADTTRQKMLQLIALIAQDADTAELDQIFRQETKLSYSLLRLVNSAAIAPRTPITSFAQAINLLGRRQLERWLQLLIYADPENDHHPNPLLYKAAIRGRLMELLSVELSPAPDLPNLADGAFMIGSFSLLDVLLNMPMAEILQQLPLASTVNAALAHHGGAAGKLLLALEAADRRNLPVATGILDELGIDPARFVDAQMQALSWAGRIHTAA